MEERALTDLSKEELIEVVELLKARVEEEVDINNKLWQDNVVLAQKCKEHHEKVQELLAIEFKRNSKRGHGHRKTWGVVNGTGEVFSINKDGTGLQREKELPFQSADLAASSTGL